jgi:hypothetical protein
VKQDVEPADDAAPLDLADEAVGEEPPAGLPIREGEQRDRLRE